MAVHGGGGAGTVWGATICLASQESSAVRLIPLREPASELDKHRARRKRLTSVGVSASITLYGCLTGVTNATDQRESETCSVCYRLFDLLVGVLRLSFARCFVPARVPLPLPLVPAYAALCLCSVRVSLHRFAGPILDDDPSPLVSNRRLDSLRFLWLRDCFSTPVPASRGALN